MTFDPAAPQLHATVTRMGLCVAGSLLLAAVTLLPRSWRGRVRRPDRTIWPTWRMLAAACSFNATFV